MYQKQIFVRSRRQNYFQHFSFDYCYYFVTDGFEISLFFFLSSHPGQFKFAINFVFKLNNAWSLNYTMAFPLNFWEFKTMYRGHNSTYLSSQWIQNSSIIFKRHVIIIINTSNFIYLIV